MVIEHLMKTRGLSSVRIRKVRSHLSRCDVDAGLITLQDWIGNGRADTIADEGALMYAAWRKEAYQGLCLRAEAVSKLVRLIQSTLVDVLCASSSKRKANSPFPSPVRAGKKLVAVVMNPVPQGDPVRPRAYVIPRLRRARVDNVGWFAKLKHFVTKTDWIPCDKGGMTWIQLLVIFELMHDVHVPGSDVLCGDSRLNPVHSVRDILNLFKRTFASIVASHVHPEDRPLFKSVSKGSHSLRQAGYNGCITAVSSWPIVATHFEELSFFACLRLRRQLPAGWQELHSQGRLFLPSSPIRFQQPPCWRSHRPGHCAVSPSGDRLSGAPYAILCPTQCGATITLSDKPCHLGRGWPKVKCAACGVASRVGLATCMLCRCAAKDCNCV